VNLTLPVVLVVYTISAFGLAFAVGFGRISLPFRRWLEPKTIVGSGDAFRQMLLYLLECPACLGFWIGLGASFFVQLDDNRLSLRMGAALLTAFYTSGSNFILGRVSGLIREDA
jgi:hypothetical protein